MSEERIFVTNDKVLHQPEVLAPADVEMMKGAQSGGIPINSVEQLMELAKAARERFDEFREMCKDMTVDQATVVRELRVDKGYSWRAIAQACYDLGWGKWYPPSNQIMGMALCERAAQFFNEHYMMPPWN